VSKLSRYLNLPFTPQLKISDNDELFTVREEVLALGLHTSYSVQIQNACLAMAVLRFLNVSTEGLKTFFWPCRMERFVLDGVTLILDGCHNDDSVRQFMLGLKEKYPDSSVIVLFGAGMEKYLPDMLGHVFESADSTVMVQSRHFKSLSEIDLVAAVDGRFRHLLQSSGSRSQAPPPYDRQDSGTIAERLLWNIKHAK
jgi:folylpolyglutamate synthase/dihydropteroate synthase